MRDNLIKSATAVVAAVAAVLVYFKSIPWLFAILLAIALIAVATLFGAWFSNLVGWFVRRRKAKPPKPATPFMSRWRISTDGMDAPSVSFSFGKSVSHAAAFRRGVEAYPAKIMVSVFVPCAPISDETSTSELVNSFLELLEGPAIRRMVGTLSEIPEGSNWHSCWGNGALNNQAVLARSADRDAPIATAILNLNDSSIKYQHFQDPMRAELIITVEPSRSRMPLTLSDWHSWLMQLFELPATFSHFLSNDAHLSTYDTLNVLAGVQFAGHQNLGELFAVEAFASPSGAVPSSSFPIYLLADRDGKEPRGIAVDALRNCCDYGLHIHGYEQELNRLRRATLR